ncbi:DNA primase, partial [Candidatus Pacearchaeota archaeon]|nr:DNA primase [Candidatus Pacearchaeota archaeon]
MRISDSDIERVKEASEILGVVSDYFPLKKAGQNYRALCPFHHEKTASFMVNPAKQIYHCFGCRSGGNVFSFIMGYEKLEFPEAVKFLAGKSGIQLAISDNDRREEDKTEPIYNALEQACMLYQKKFPNSIAEDYIKKRGVNDDTIAQFRLGYSPDVESWAFLLNEMKGKFDAGTLEQAGLIRKGARSEKYFDMFRGRLMFPIFNSTGRVVGFGARILGNTDNDAPKYLNSPEGPLFSKGRLLYGLNFASRAVREKYQIIVAEGYTDVLNLH